MYLMNKEINLKIRNFKQEDFVEIFGMMKEFYASPAVLCKASDEVLRRDIADCISTLPFVEGFVFEDDGILLGYSVVSKSYSTEAGGICVWIEYIFIKSQFRGLGIAKIFFDYIENLYKETAVRFRLEAEPSNSKAIGVYKRAGYEELLYTQLVKKL